MTGQPQHLMRFYGNCQYALESIAFKQITFLHIGKLNDPFDSNFSFDTDFEADYQTLLNYVQKHHAKDIQKFKERLPKRNWQQVLEDMDRFFNNQRNSTFIFSTSEISDEIHPENNLHMWGHYGNGHRGVAIEFDTSLLIKSVLEKNPGGEKIDENKILFKIDYRKEIPKISCEHIFDYVVNAIPKFKENSSKEPKLAGILKERTSSKHINWIEEKEWRLMSQNVETMLKIQRFDLLADTITAVYLGFRYPLSSK